MATKIKVKKLLAALLAAVLLVPVLGWVSAEPLKAEAAVKAELNDHRLIAENGNYALYLNEDYLSVIVLDKATGA